MQKYEMNCLYYSDCVCLLAFRHVVVLLQAVLDVPTEDSSRGSIPSPELVVTNIVKIYSRRKSHNSCGSTDKPTEPQQRPLDETLRLVSHASDKPRLLPPIRNQGMFTYPVLCTSVTAHRCHVPLSHSLR